MGKKEGAADTIRIAIRLDRDVLRRARRLEDTLGHVSGARTSRSDVLREALLRGLDVLEAGRSRT
jgi:Arc/MetJ-type ribon-helix-helix transcriptional regulator